MSKIIIKDKIEDNRRKRNRAGDPYPEDLIARSNREVVLYMGDRQ